MDPGSGSVHFHRDGRLVDQGELGGTAVDGEDSRDIDRLGTGVDIRIDLLVRELGVAAGTDLHVGTADLEVMRGIIGRGILDQDLLVSQFFVPC